MGDDNMRTFTKISMFLCIALLTAFAASAATTASLPSQSDVQNYITSANIAGPGYAEKLGTQIKTSHPTWYYDIWNDGNAKVISVYFSDNSGDGHGSTYYDDNGKVISPGAGLTPIESYKGTATASTGSTSNTATSNTTQQSTTTPTGSSCPNCQKAQNTASTYQSTTSTCTGPNCPQAQSAAPTISVNSGSTSLTAEQQKQLDEFMSYFDGKESVTVDGIREQAKKSFFNGV